MPKPEPQQQSRAAQKPEPGQRWQAEPTPGPAQQRQAAPKPEPAQQSRAAQKPEPGQHWQAEPTPGPAQQRQAAPKPDLAFAIHSLEVSSISLRSQLADPALRAKGREKLLEALENHQRTLGRLMRKSPLHGFALAMRMAGSLGTLRSLSQEENFTPSSPKWDDAARQWGENRRMAVELLEKDISRFENGVSAHPSVSNLQKSFSLALLSCAIALFLDDHSTRLSALLSGDRYKSTMSALKMEELV